MGNEGSIPSETESQASDWQSLYSYGSRAGRRSSLGSMRIPSPMDPPEPDLSHLSPEEVAKIREVIGRAKTMKDEEHKRIRKLEEEYVAIANDVERRATEAVAGRELRKDAPLCPICLKSELKIKEGKMKEGQNVCVDCGNLICLNCGSMEQSVTSKEMEWVCQVCHKRRQLVLSSGLWHPGCDVDDDIPLAREIEHRLCELEKASVARGPLVRSASLDAPEGAIGGPSLQRQLSLPDYQMSSSYTPGHTLEVIQETGHSGNASENVSPEPSSTKTESPTGSDEMKKSTSSVGGNSFRAMGQPSSRSESEYSDGPSDVDMPDVSMLRSGTDGISPDDGSDDYSFMSIGSSDDNSGIIRRKHRPKSLNLSRSISATSSEDETSDSAISTDVESKYGGVPPPDPHEIRIALAASAFVEEMRGVDIGNETDDEVAELSALEEANDGAKIRFSPSAPVSPSWREGLESPPFSPRRRDSYPGKRRGSSPVSPKDKKFTYNDISPPSRQLSLEDMYDKDSHGSFDEQSHAHIAQRLSPKSPEDRGDPYYGVTGEMMPFDRPTSNLKKSKPFYSLDDASVDLNDTTTVMDLATYAATVASNTANLTSMTVSPTNIETRTDIVDMHDHVSPESMGTSSPVSPGYYDNVSYPEERQDEEEEVVDDIELADPSQKPIDYQGSKRQKARPPTTDWSPVIDLSPILDVSPSLEEAEQAEMLAQQQEERQRQASREDESYSPDNFVDLSSGAAGVDYMYYGLKRYDVVENISELVQQNNGLKSPEIASVCSTESEDRNMTTSNHVIDKDENFVPPVACSTSVPSKFSDTASTSMPGTNANRPVYSCEPVKCTQPLDAAPSPKSILPKTDSPVTKRPEDTKEQTVVPASNKNKTRRKLPEPTAEIIATQRAPVPKPRRKDRPAEPPPPPAKPARASKSETKEPSRAAPTLVQANNVTKQGTNKPQTRQPLRKQDSEERKRTARDMKAKPDPVVMNHINTEDASSSPQYKVLESPPSPENKAAIRREYSDSTSVSPSSSPDREVYLYPSPVTPPDSDSSPPKPHSPSSGTDFEEEFVYMEESPKLKSKHPGPSAEKRHESKYNNHQEKTYHDSTQSGEKDGVHTKNKQPPVPPRDHKSKEMKKVRRKLPPIPAEEENTQNSRAKSRPVPPRKPPPRADSKSGRRKPGTSSTSDDSSMNEDDKEVASITRKKSINDLDKPSLDKRNGNYITVVGPTNNGVLDIYRPDDGLQVNIPPDPEVNSQKYSGNMVKYFDETDEIIDSLINIYGAPITQAMKGLKKRLQEELRRVTEGRRRKIDEIEELRALKIQLNEMKLGADKNRSTSKGSLSVPGSNGKKRTTSNSRTSPQLINRRARHKRQSSDPMVAKFSPIKEDKDIESEMQVVASDDSRSCRTADDSSQSGISDTESTRSEPVLSAINRSRKPKTSDYAKMFYSKHAQSTETLDKGKDSSHMISSHSEGNLPIDAEDEEDRIREEKRRELQFEIEKRKKQLAERQAQLKETRSSLGATNKQLAHSCDEISSGISVPAFIPPRPIPTGIIKPIDDDDDEEEEEEDIIPYKSSYQNQSYSSTEYLAHKQEELMRQRYDGLSSFSSPFLYSAADSGEKSAFVPQITRTHMDAYSYSTGNVNVSKDKIISSSATLPNMPTARQDLENNNRPVSDTESSPPSMSTPAMPLLIDVKDRSRKIIHEIGSGSRPVSAEFNVGVEESDNSVDADEPIMKHMMEGGVTILKQLERRKQPQPAKPKKYEYPVKRILLTTDPKEKSGRPGNSIGMKIIGGKSAPGSSEVGAYVATIYKGGIADQLHGEVSEGDQILEWNGIELTGRSYEEVQQIIANPNGEIELVIRTLHNSQKVLGDTTAQAPSCHSSYDNLDSDEERETKRKPSMQGVDPKQLAAKLEGIEEDESPSISHSSSQQDYNTASASSGCSSPLSEPTSTSSEHHSRTRRPVATATASMGPPPIPAPRIALTTANNTRQRIVNQGSPARNTSPNRPSVSPNRMSSSPLQASPSPHQPSPSSQNAQKITPSSSEYSNLKRNNSCETPPKLKSNSLDAPPSGRQEQFKSKSPTERMQRGQGSIKKRDLSQQSSSFDDFLRMSHHAGVDDRNTTSPSRGRDRASKKSLSASTSQLDDQKRAETHDDIQKSLRGSSRGDRQMGDIQLQLAHDEGKHEFRVHVKQARNLLPKDINGLSDPFVKLYLLPGRCSDNKRRTKHIPRTLNPEWNEKILFPNVHIEELKNKTLEITVWDYDRFKNNDFLGEVVLNLSEAAFLDNIPHWYPLCDHDSNKGMELPQATVLPPRPNSKTGHLTPRSKSRERTDKHNQSPIGGMRNERVRTGMGRRRRSFDTLQDVDKV